MRGPDYGFACNARIGLIRNKDDIAVKKRSSNSKEGGDTGRLPSAIYYCGRKMQMNADVVVVTVFVNLIMMSV